MLSFVRGALRKLPIEALTVLLALIGAIGFVHCQSSAWFARLFLTGVLVTPLAVAVHRRGLRVQAIATALASAGVLAALVHAVPRVADVEAARFGWPYLLSLLAATLVPFVTAVDPQRFVRRFFEETTTFALLGAGVFAAYGLIVLALNGLFDLHLERSALDGGLVLGAAIVLLYLERVLADDSVGRVPVLWRRLATLVGAPFVSIMLVILVVYEAIALVRGELPRNLLSPLILAAGLVGFLTTQVLIAVMDVPVRPVLAADPHRWTRTLTIRLARAFPVVLLALLPMAAWALRIRLEEYGVTPFRHARAAGLSCLAVLSLASVARWWRGRPPLTWQVPAVVAVFALGTAFGPLAAVPLSVRSQVARLGMDLARHGSDLVVRETPRAIPVDPEEFWRLDRALYQFTRLGGEGAIRALFTGELKHCTDAWGSTECLEHLGFVSRDRQRTFNLARRGPVAVHAGTLESLSLSRVERAYLPEGEPRTLQLVDDEVIAYAHRQVIGRADLRDLRTRGIASTTQDLPAETVRIVSPSGAVVGELAIERLEGELEPLRCNTLFGSVIWSGEL